MRRLYWIALAAAVCLGAGVLSSSYADSQTRLRIINGLSEYDIHYVKISLATSDDWNDDRLDADQKLRPGQTETWLIEPGTWDIRCIDEDRDMYTRWRVCIPEGMTVEWRVTISDMDDD